MPWSRASFVTLLAFALRNGAFPQNVERVFGLALLLTLFKRFVGPTPDDPISQHYIRFDLPPVRLAQLGLSFVGLSLQLSSASLLRALGGSLVIAAYAAVALEAGRAMSRSRDP